MGKTPDEIEREVAAQRASIGSHLDSMRSRMKRDVHSAEEGLQQDADRVGQAVRIDEIVGRRPLTAVAAAAGAGAAFGMASRRGSARQASRSEARPARSRRRQSASASGGLGSIVVGSVTSSLSEVISEELGSIVDQFRKGRSDATASATPRGPLPASQSAGAAS